MAASRSACGNGKRPPDHHHDGGGRCAASPDRGINLDKPATDDFTVMTPQCLAALLPTEPPTFEERWATLQQIIDEQRAGRVTDERKRADSR
jgi:hypothetical protein